MGHGKETPRQKMIGMMYLVLTALLALNVAKDILDAFVIVDEGLIKTTENFAEKNNLLYDEFTKAAISNPTKAGPYRDKAFEVKKKADDVYKMIQTLKIQIIKKADKKTQAVDAKNEIHPGKIQTKEVTDVPAEIMVGDNNNGKGRELKAKFDDFRNYVLSLVDKSDEDLIKSINSTLDTKDLPTEEGVRHTWESAHFEHWPLIAVTTIMSKLQSDVRNVESDVIHYLYNNIESGSFKFNKLQPTVIANSNYILRGNEYKAEVFMAAFDTTQSPTILVGNVQKVTGADGKEDYQIVGGKDSLKIDPVTRKGIYTRSGNSVGNQKWGGIIQLKATDGSIIRKPFTAEYQVAESGVVISPLKMNVFYIGVDNPVSISVPGVGSDKITATNTNGPIRKEGNGWIVNPRNIGNAIITVNAKIDGKDKQVGMMEFRVKNIPDPIAKVAGKKGGGIDKNVLTAQSIVQADLEGFDFDAKFTVTEFTVSALVKGFSQDVTVKATNKISEKQKDIIRNLNRGEKVYFQDIKAVGPDGKPRDLNTVYFKIQ
jgi:gliding motility-associated protein GldM